MSKEILKQILADYLMQRASINSFLKNMGKNLDSQEIDDLLDRKLEIEETINKIEEDLEKLTQAEG